MNGLKQSTDPAPLQGATRLQCCQPWQRFAAPLILHFWAPAASWPFLRPSLRFVIRTVGFSLARLAFLFPPNKIVVPFRNQLVGPSNASFTTLFGRQLSLLESAHSPSHEPHSSGRRFNSASGRIHSDWAAHFNVVPEFVQLIRSRDIGPFTHHPPRQISL